MTFRHFLSWKPLFYEILLPALRILGPSASDAALAAIGRAVGAWPPRKEALKVALARARSSLDAHWDLGAARVALSANLARAQARDYPLDIRDSEAALGRFEVSGAGHLRAALEGGRGAIVLGSHLGAYLASIHWLLRSGVPIRLLVQRPRHVSRDLRRRLDRDDGPHPQSSFFLRRGLPPAEAAARMLRARDALRSGLAVYLSGDVPWCSASARPGRLLGRDQTFLSVWADLAAFARSPVVPVFCTHLPGGRFRLRFDAPVSIAPGEQGPAVARYLARLESVIAEHPADAVAHLTWPCYRA